jgi:hypothetical protein
MDTSTQQLSQNRQSVYGYYYNRPGESPVIRNLQKNSLSIRNMSFTESRNMLKNFRDINKPFCSTNRDLLGINEHAAPSDYGMHYNNCLHQSPEEKSQATATLFPESAA